MRAFLGVAVALLVASSTLAQEHAEERFHLSLGSVRDDVVHVVDAQLAAFRTDDWPAAYELAARSFQNVVSARAFVTLISKNYLVVWKNTRADFGIPSDNGRVAIVPVRVFGPGGSEAYTWLLIKEDGKWRITGVVPQRTGGA